jgi:hypothetical protein
MGNDDHRLYRGSRGGNRAAAALDKTKSVPNRTAGVRLVISAGARSGRPTQGNRGDAKPDAADSYSRYGFFAAEVVEDESDPRPQPTAIFPAMSAIKPILLFVMPAAFAPRRSEGALASANRCG